MSLRIFDKPAFLNDILAWQYGPVIKEIYQKYKGGNPINTPKTNYEVCEGLKKIIQLVVTSYGQMEAGSLITLTHDEDPWINSESNGIININMIKEYFDKVYE